MTSRAGLFFMITLFQGAASYSTGQNATDQYADVMSELPKSSPFPYGPDPFPTDRQLQRHGNTSKHTRCAPCFERHAIPKFHRHFSTKYFQEKMAIHSNIYPCPSCKYYHENQNDRCVVIYSASTLHDVIFDPAVRLQQHCNIETICGARIQDMYNDWSVAYKKQTQPTDLIVVATANDVPCTSPELYDSLITKWTFELWNQNKESTFRICKMLCPPAKAWFPRDGPVPDGYINHLDHINSLNEVIDRQNYMNVNGPVIGFNTEGCRTSRKRKSNDHRGEISHVFGAWRENSQGKTAGYHLTDQNRVLMFKRLITYIKNHLQKI